MYIHELSDEDDEEGDDDDDDDDVDDDVDEDDERYLHSMEVPRIKAIEPTVYTIALRTTILYCFISRCLIVSGIANSGCIATITVDRYALEVSPVFMDTGSTSAMS